MGGCERHDGVERTPYSCNFARRRHIAMYADRRADRRSWRPTVPEIARTGAYSTRFASDRATSPTRRPAMRQPDRALNEAGPAMLASQAATCLAQQIDRSAERLADLWLKVADSFTVGIRFSRNGM